MEKIEFGSALVSAREIPEFARYAEELGYDYLCSGEHMMFHGPDHEFADQRFRSPPARPQNQADEHYRIAAALQPDGAGED